VPGKPVGKAERAYYRIVTLAHYRINKFLTHETFMHKTRQR